MKRTSLKLRLTIASALATGAALFLIALLLISGIDRHLRERTAHDLSHQLDQLAALFLLDETGAPVLEAELSDPRYDRPLSGLYWQIDGQSGPVLRSRSLWDSILNVAGAPNGGMILHESEGPGGNPLLALSRDVTLRNAAGERRAFRLSVALDAAELTLAREAVLRPVLIGLVLAGLALVAAAWAQLGFGLKPLEAMRRELERVRVGAAQRLGLEAFPAEIRPLGEEINTLLDGHHALVQRARRRAGDLAHGLKTPLAALTAQADLLAGKGEAEAAAALRRHVSAMQAHVERELALARSQGAKLAPGTGASAVAELQAAVDVLRKLPGADALDWSVTGDGGIIVPMAPDDFAEIVGNLLDNARKWARSRVSASVVRHDGGIEIAIADDGPGIAPQAHAAALDRGARLDEQVPGSGLGLSIVVSILESYGLQLDLGEAEGGGLLVRFSLPGERAASA